MKKKITLARLGVMSFCVASHIAFTGHSQELKEFLRLNCNKLVFIGHPFSYSFTRSSVAQFYEKGLLKEQLNFPSPLGFELILFFKDFISSFYFILKIRRRFHVFVGVDPLNAFAGLLIKRLGFAKYTIFYVIDYIPKRFGNSILNCVYHCVDKICVKNSDCTWNLTSVMANARERVGIKKGETNQIVVPTGTHIVVKKIVNDTNSKTIAFLSHLRKGQGIELVLEVLPTVVKEIPSVKVIVIGTGPLEEYFKKEVKKLGVEQNVCFLGFIKDHRKIERIISNCKIGIAPYVPVLDSYTWYADPGKPKVYLGCGIPVIITRVPQIAKEISRRSAGIAINYSARELEKAIILLLRDSKLYESYRMNAISFALTLDWGSIFSNVLSEIELKN